MYTKRTFLGMALTTLAFVWLAASALALIR
jgi:hypothetical protein